MAKALVLKHKRRRMKKTDYPKRLALLKSRKVRLVVRKSLSQINIQFIKYNESGDTVLSSLSSKELKKMGWKFSCDNVPAAYLAGLLAGFHAKSAGIKEAVVDIGMQVSTKGSKLYAAIKGVIDAGVAVAVSQEILPTPERVAGKHISQEVEKCFEETKQKILEQFG